MFPNNLKPMPLKRHYEPFSHPDWFFELKHDGFRALAFIQNGKCRLVSRNGNDFRKFDFAALVISATSERSSGWQPTPSALAASPTLW
jgi:ATP-dependent DNA ligase